MKLLKVTNGLLEAERFGLASSFNDYFSKNDMKLNNNKAQINCNNKIERSMNYPQFVIEINKDNWNSITIDDEFIFYVGSDTGLYGIRDYKKKGQSQYQKIIYYDHYIQCLSSNDRINWTNVGGIKETFIDKQGFIKHSDKSITLNEYKIYRSPYVTLQNFNENTKVELYDKNNELLKVRNFDENNLCKIYLDYCLQGYFKFYDIDNKLLYQSGLMNLQYGDTYCYSDYELELEYKNITLDDIPTCLDSGDEVITVKNVSDKNTYKNLKIYAESEYDDITTLSFDGKDYKDNIIIKEIKPNEKIDIYIKISKGKTNHNFECRNFELKLEQI